MVDKMWKCRVCGQFPASHRTSKPSANLPSDASRVLHPGAGNPLPLDPRIEKIISNSPMRAKAAVRGLSNKQLLTVYSRMHMSLKFFRPLTATQAHGVSEEQFLSLTTMTFSTEGGDRRANYPDIKSDEDLRTCWRARMLVEHVLCPSRTLGNLTFCPILESYIGSFGGQLTLAYLEAFGITHPGRSLSDYSPELYNSYFMQDVEEALLPKWSSPRKHKSDVPSLKKRKVVTRAGPKDLAQGDMHACFAKKACIDFQLEKCMESGKSHPHTNPKNQRVTTLFHICCRCDGDHGLLNHP